jgi:PmbA protein
MIAAAELKSFARTAAHLVARDREIAQFEIYCASAEHRIARLNYTSDIPSRGLEEFKSLHADGFQVRIVMRRDAREVGSAYEASDLSLEAVRGALKRARRATVVDPHFPGLPSGARRLAASAGARSDLARASDAVLARCAWSVIGGALKSFGARAAARIQHPGLVVGGDVSITRDRIAIASSNFADIRADESAHFSSSVAVLVESLDSKGTATAVGVSAAQMRRATAALGRDAVERALALSGGVRPPSGTYRVVFGPQPIAEILNYMVMGSLTTAAFHAANSAYQGRFGERVMDGRLTLLDDPALPRGAVRRRITCEGLRAARVTLIRDGRLAGLYSNFYDSHRLETDERHGEKLGPAGEGARFAPRSGYRLGEGGGRHFDSHPGSAGTNVLMRTRSGVDWRDVVRAAGDGIYIGRVWYTYPINGQRAGDFTCTVSGDSHLIRNGELAEPLAPNSLRVNANIAQVFSDPLAVENRSHAAIVWGSPEAYYVPAIAAGGIALAGIERPS